MQIEDALDILNLYRNQHYMEGRHTEAGMLADAINTVLPNFSKLNAAKPSAKGDWLQRYICPRCNHISVTVSEFCPKCYTRLLHQNRG